MSTYLECNSSKYKQINSINNNNNTFTHLALNKIGGSYLSVVRQIVVQIRQNVWVPTKIVFFCFIINSFKHATAHNRHRECLLFVCWFFFRITWNKRERISSSDTHTAYDQTISISIVTVNERYRSGFWYEILMLSILPINRVCDQNVTQIVYYLSDIQNASHIQIVE